MAVQKSKQGMGVLLMSYRVKKMTEECPKCEYLESNENNRMVCRWGESKYDKVLTESKSKTPVHCRLIKNDNSNKS